MHLRGNSANRVLRIELERHAVSGNASAMTIVRMSILCTLPRVQGRCRVGESRPPSNTDMVIVMIIVIFADGKSASSWKQLLDEWTVSVPTSSYLLARSPVVRGDLKVGARIDMFRLSFSFTRKPSLLPCLRFVCIHRWFSNPRESSIGTHISVLQNRYQ